ncbi:MAG TPA: right-handed parallel beta-helix repeat-containing protein, partial [Polyangiaceae bacterium]
LLGPTRTGSSINDVAAEASNRQAVRLTNVNDSVTIKNLNASNSIVVRYSVPDNGLDYTGTLSLYVNGTKRQKLAVTSRYSWTYGGVNDFNNVGVEKNAGAGSPHHFFDEVHALTGDIPVGASVKLQKDADDNAAHYDIDLIDMEQVASAPAAKPAGFMSIVDCGAIPNDGKDDGPAIQLCFTRSKSLYIPEGVFNMTTKEISAQGATIRGAGMWRSVLKGFYARFDCYAGGCKFYDFAIDGDSTHRDDSSPETGFTGNGMSGSLIEHVWVEHKKLGVWTGNNTTGLTIRNSRFRDLYADGINLSCGTSNSLIEHTNIRNSGDDSFAAWSANTCPNEQNNIFRNVYAQLPWRANCFGIYGGGTTIQDSVCSDTQYPGILLGAMFNSNAFTATKVTGVSLLRAGGPQYGEQGALKLNPEQGPIQNIQISNVDIDSATYSAVQFAAGNTIDTVSLAGVNITKPGGCGLLAQGGGAADVSNVVISGAGSALCNEKGFNFIKGAGNVGW